MFSVSFIFSVCIKKKSRTSSARDSSDLMSFPLFFHLDQRSPGRAFKVKAEKEKAVVKHAGKLFHTLKISASKVGTQTEYPKKFA